MSIDRNIAVGCEVLVVNQGRLLLGKRKNVFGAGSWGLPGGHLEYKERAIDAACRELKEEIDADIKPAELKLVSIVDTPPPKDGDEHHIHITFEIQSPSFEPKLMEPDACERWRYFQLDSLPTEIFFSHKDIIENYLQNRLYNK